MLEILTLTLGPAMTNTYLLADSATGDAAVVDPAWDGKLILAEARKRNWRIAHLWYTHAHFDHIGGAAEIADALNPLPLVALHPNDHVLWRAGGGGALFGFKIDPGPEPSIDFTQGQLLRLGARGADWQSAKSAEEIQFEVRFTPGHTPGHCVLVCAQEKVCFCGDLIFAGSVGRTDLPGGDWDTLEASIRQQIYTLPDDTRLLSGHGPETTVGEERKNNPFVRGA
jgi:glyoxylase-like metal-dependent hydrolase (beta-lactamase superfamily II)